jgi:hypothetical protein
VLLGNVLVASRQQDRQVRTYVCVCWNNRARFADRFFTGLVNVNAIACVCCAQTMCAQINKTLQPPALAGMLRPVRARVRV